jgi:hypothetical protein
MDFFDPSHSCSQDIRNIALRFFQSCNGISTDHPSVSNDTEPLNTESTFQPIHYRQEAFDVSCITWPHLAADRTALIVKDRSDHHLLAISSVVFAMPKLANSLSSGPFEVNGGCVEKDQLKACEKIEMSFKEPLFDEVFRASWRERCCSSLVAQDFPKKSHGSIHMVKSDIINTSNGVATTPVITRPIGTGDKEPMQNCKEDSSLNIKLKFPISKQPFDNRWQAKLIPEPFENQCWTDLDGMSSDINFPRENKKRLLRKSGQRTDEYFNASLCLELVKAPDSSNDSLSNFASDLAVFDNLQVLISTGFFCSCKHEGLLC